MEAFDALPTRVRRALSMTRYTWPAHGAAGMLAHGLSEDAVIAVIEQHDAELARMREQDRAVA
jgi:hypothetical protein